MRYLIAFVVVAGCSSPIQRVALSVQSPITVSLDSDSGAFSIFGVQDNIATFYVASDSRLDDASIVFSATIGTEREQLFDGTHDNAMTFRSPQTGKCSYWNAAALWKSPPPHWDVYFEGTCLTDDTLHIKAEMTGSDGS